MGIIVKFPRHQRAAIGSRAARSAKVLAVNPALRAVLVFKIADHHSTGMLSRCGHLRAAQRPAPISAANTSGEPHSSTISRKLETMDASIGRAILNCKDDLCPDRGKPVGHTVHMKKRRRLSLVEAALVLRTRQARMAAQLTQEQIAEKLGIWQDTYKNYETNRPLPPRLHPAFLECTGTDAVWFVLGPQPVPQPAPSAAKKRRRALRARSKRKIA